MFNDCLLEDTVNNFCIKNIHEYGINLYII